MAKVDISEIKIGEEIARTHNGNVVVFRCEMKK